MSEASTAVASTVNGRRPRARVDGVLLLDKPSGISSNAALQRARRLLNAAKAGHTGTLDPLATGLLPVCFGEATKFAQVLLDSRKEYLATVQFGVATTTGDAEGEITDRAAIAFGTSELLDSLQRFIGTSQQIPPRHSALKYQGRNHYEYARAGIELPRPPRAVEIDALDLVEHEGARAVLRVACSKGTYVRTLVEDVAKTLGTVAHLAALRRLATGPFRIEQAHRLEDVESMEENARASLLLATDAPLADTPRMVLSAEDAIALLQGRTPSATAHAPGRVRAYDAHNRFLGLAEVDAGIVRAVRLVHTTASPSSGGFTG